MASLACMLATKVLPQKALIPFTSCRLIALNKHPGVRPIRVCEVLCRILAKAVLQVISTDIVETGGFLQKCSGMSAGIEAAVHPIKRVYEDPTTEGILFVDAKNAVRIMHGLLAVLLA